MEILLANTDIKMVYYEVARYIEEEFLAAIPNPQIPIEQKQGTLFSYLILYPLISTQTMLVDKEAFISIGGFEETLGAAEDYEFSIRFSYEFLIGFAEDTYVKAYDSNDSVNKRWKEIIRTQIYISKMALTVYEADCYGHRKFAIEELKKVHHISES